MATKPQKGAKEEVAKLIAKYGVKAVKEAEAWAARNFENQAAGLKRIPTKEMSKKARKLTQGQIKNDKQWSKYVDRTMSRKETRGTLNSIPRLRKTVKRGK